MSDLARALVQELDDAALDALAQLLAPRMAVQPAPEQAGYLAPAAAAEYLGVSRKRVYDLTSSRALAPDGFDGRTPLFTRASLDSYVRGALTQR
jgi:excisionase family DNA binding protein